MTVERRRFQTDLESGGKEISQDCFEVVQESSNVDHFLPWESKRRMAFH